MQRSPRVGQKIVDRVERGFVDGGGMYTGPVGELAASTGFGLVWRSPLGPIGAYWAWPSLHDPPKFVFGIGSAF